MTNFSAAAADGRSCLVFIDGGVQCIDTLIDAVPGGARLVVLDPTQDGIAQMAAVFAEHSRLDEIHVLSHGAPGCIHLGSATLDAVSLDHYASRLRSIGAALKDDGDLLIYGCEVANGATGRHFIAQLAAVTGVNVAASSTLTGDTRFGGDWLLEHHIGHIRTAALHAPNFAGVLAAPAVIELSALNGTDGFPDQWRSRG